MTEIYTSNAQNVYLDLINETADTTPTVTLTRQDGTVVPLGTSTVISPPAGITERYYTLVGLANTLAQTQLKITWTLVINGETITKVDYIDVVTPYLTLSEVKAAIDSTITDDQAIAAESIVRHIINAHTGQSFGYSVDKTITVEGHGDRSLRLPERLLKITGFNTISANLDPRTTLIVSDGWYLKKGWSDVLSAITNDALYWNTYSWDEEVNHGHIIVAPGAGGTPTPWRDDYPFTITGDWGYETVPAAVREAAKLLVSDYFCQDVKYRDAYLESIKAADWRLQFSSRSWEYTGNVRADQLLAEFVLLDWLLI